MLKRRLPRSTSITHRYDRSDHSGGHVQGLKKPPTCRNALFDTIFFWFRNSQYSVRTKINVDGWKVDVLALVFTTCSGLERVDLECFRIGLFRCPSEKLAFINISSYVCYEKGGSGPRRRDSGLYILTCLRC